MDMVVLPVLILGGPLRSNKRHDNPTEGLIKSRTRALAAAVEAQQLIMIFIILILATTAFCQVSAQSNFSVKSTAYDCTSNMICLGTAHKYTGRGVSNGVQLNGKLSLIEEETYGTQGIAYYHEPVRFQDLATQQAYNFNTSFAMTTVQGRFNGTATVGDGMAFVVSADNSTLGGIGKYFGFFNDRGITNFKSVVVEFDTYDNPDVYDINSNHVSFDFANVVYAVAANASKVNVTLGDDGTVYAWVEYRHQFKQLDVRISNSNVRPFTPLLKYNVDLFQYVAEYMWVGFSSGSGNFYSNCYVGDWTFDSYLDASGSAPASSPNPALSPAALSNNPGAGTPTEQKSGTNSRTKLGIIVGISTGVPACLLACIVIALFVRRSSRKDQLGSRRGWRTTEKDPTMQLEGMPERFSYKQLSVGTRGFSQEAKLGQGGFGSVYRGVLPSSGIPVAVKKINSDSSQGEREFMAEVSIISRLRHRNLIHLQGWCKDASKGYYLLVYELMPNGSLDKALFQGPTEVQMTCLSWPQRFNIVTGTAAAVDYLHQGWTQQVIHRDIKASNIMLDKDWTAKLGDFGLARLVDHQKEAATTLVAGTYGYIAPEVPSTGRFTDKSDVYAFGVVVLEVACGRQALSTLLPLDEMILVDWVWQSLSEGDLLRTVDKRLESYDNYWMEVMLRVGLLCSHPDPLARPSMKHVVQILAGDLPVPSIPSSKPALVFSSRSETVSLQAPKGSNSTSWNSFKSRTPGSTSLTSTNTSDSPQDSITKPLGTS